jgi:murein DD-endopeptidase MepM/ murein hydrolase activator NlpD
MSEVLRFSDRTVRGLMRPVAAFGLAILAAGCSVDNVRMELSGDQTRQVAREDSQAYRRWTGDDERVAQLRQGERRSSERFSTGQIERADASPSRAVVEPASARPSLVVMRGDWREERERQYQRGATPAEPWERAGQERVAGDEHIVRTGETLYSIARRYGVHPMALADYNNLADPSLIRIGERLRIPAGDYRSQRSRRDPERSRAEPRAGERLPASGPAPRMTRSDESADPYADPLLRDPAARDRRLAEPRPQTQAPRAVAADRGAPASAAAPAPEQRPAPRPETRAAPTRQAARPANPSPPARSSADCSHVLQNPPPLSRAGFRRPVTGAVIARFGSAADGTRNDGIKISVPRGTPVHAAENGVVVYSGDELTGMGRLILVRHADGWVTAYAHNDEVLVARCDLVERGQVIAKAGMTGAVSKPLVHFELRKDARPTDPEAHFAGTS